jgi:hypothetical protein
MFWICDNYLYSPRIHISFSDEKCSYNGHGQKKVGTVKLFIKIYSKSLQLLNTVPSLL